jgi:APA family basic amino acid/polyamine antiporter
MKPALRRDLNLVAAVGVGLGAIIGAGIFVVTGVAAGVAGPAFLIGLLLAGLVAAFNALSSAQLAAAYPQSGGTYEYGYQVLHPWLGFAAGWMFLASKLAAGGTVALGFAGYLNALIPGLPERPVAVAAVLLLTLVNYYGVQKTGLINSVIVAVSILALLIFILAGLPSVRAENFRPFAPAGVGAVFQSAALLFFAYTGYARLATLGEEVREPRKTIPRAIILALAIAALLYLAVAFVAVGSIGAAGMAASTAPIESAAGAFRWPQISRVVAIGATAAMLGVLLSQILGISRMIFAMARRGDLPPALAHIHPTHAVPDRGIFLTTMAMLLVVVFGTLESIVATASFTILLYYSIANLAAFRMRSEYRLYPIWVPVLGLVSCLALAVTLQPAVIAAGIGLLIAGFFLRWVFRRFNTT